VITVFNKRLSLSLPDTTPHLNVMKTSQSFSFDQTRGHFIHAFFLPRRIHPNGSVALCVGESLDCIYTTGSCSVFRPWSQPHKALPSVSAMNPPLQISSRVRWWDTRGQLKHGTVKAFNILNDSSQVVVIQVDDAQTSTITLPIDHVQLAG